MPIAALWPTEAQPRLAPPDPPAIGEDDYLAALQALLPPGRAWPRDPDTVMTQVLTGFARAYARVHTRQSAIIAEAHPGTAEALLPEWEATVGLPDPCAGLAPTLQQRRAQALARFREGDGQMPAALTAYADRLGFRIGVTEFANFRAGQSRAGDGVNGSQAPQPAAMFTAGANAAGDPLAVWLGGTDGFDWAFALKIIVLDHPELYFRQGGVIPLDSGPGAGWLDVEYFACGSSAAGDPISAWRVDPLASLARFQCGSAAGTPLASWTLTGPGGVTHFRAGVSAAGEPLASWILVTRDLGGDVWTPGKSFRAGEGACMDPIASWGEPVLECELRRIAPAHSTLSFAYQP